jgi:hypothetical protein
MQEKSKLFYLDPIVETCLFDRIDDVLLWHKLLLHANFENMVKNRRKKRVRGLQNLKKLKNALCK